jgi:hypothetical protein
MNDKLRAPCEHCKATGLFEGSECRECDGKGYRLIVDGRVVPRKFERSGMTRRRRTQYRLWCARPLREKLLGGVTDVHRLAVGIDAATTRVAKRNLLST